MVTRGLRIFQFCSVAIAAALIAMCVPSLPSSLATMEDELTPIALPGGEGGIGFDDLGFSSSLHRVLVPAGRTGTLDLIEPDNLQVQSIRGFGGSSSAIGAFRGGHGEGITSVDEG